LSHSLSPAPTYKPPPFDRVGPRHSCGCSARSVVRLQSASGEIREMIGSGGPQEGALDTVINVAVIGGAAYLVYELFFG